MSTDVDGIWATLDAPSVTVGNAEAVVIEASPCTAAGLLVMCTAMSCFTFEIGQIGGMPVLPG